MVKPKFLYHGSKDKNIKVFEPRNESIRDPDEGLVVFATPDKAYASMFLVPSDDTWTSKGQYQGQYCQIISDEKRYKRLDKGGAIYVFRTDEFKTDLAKGMKQKEWICKKPVNPIRKEIFESGLGAMRQLGVKVVFVDRKSFKDFRKKLRNGMVEEAFNKIFRFPP